MDERVHRLLILATDLETLISLQHLFEETGLDATITWDEAEVCHLLATARFDIILIGNHPHELDAAAMVIDDLTFRDTCPPVLILTDIVDEADIEHFSRLEAIGVVPHPAPMAALKEITNAFAPMQFKTKSAKAVSDESAHGDLPLEPFGGYDA